MVQYLMMRQVLQNYRTGEVWVEEVPAPALRSGAVLVANRFSLISAGTERMKVNKIANRYARHGAYLPYRIMSGGSSDA